VQSHADDQRGTPIVVVPGVGDALDVQSCGDAPPDLCRVVALDDAFAPVRERPVSEQESQSSEAQISSERGPDVVFMVSEPSEMV
jgi:hypothetical protein